MLKAMRCDEMQGFLLGKPLTADDFGDFLRGTAATAEVC
jgi:EAL domain-containing protein (putative c-di-GMP-specific phosphodiesterase class I)